MIYTKEEKVVFVAIPKTGTRSVYNVLKGKYGAVMYKEHHDTIPKEFKDYYSFTIVRNPYDRAVSMWWSTCKRFNDPTKKRAGSNFKTLAGSDKLVDLLKYMVKNPIQTNPLFSTQSSYLKKNSFDKILSTETLNEDFMTLPFLKEEIKFPKINTTVTIWGANKEPRKTNSFHYINQECLDLINEYYAEDFESLPQYEKIIKL